MSRRRGLTCIGRRVSSHEAALAARVSSGRGAGRRVLTKCTSRPEERAGKSTSKEEELEDQVRRTRRILTVEAASAHEMQRRCC